MKSAQQWLNEYAETHQNPVNIRLHSVCVPLIYWSIFALLWVIPVPAFLAKFSYANWAILVLAFGQLFYLSLGLRYFLAMLAAFGLVLIVILSMTALHWPIAWVGALVFAVAWVGQFYGHRVEGKKPAFFDDLLFLLIGPLWILRKAEIL